jgi:signal transduction histidine kinase
MENKTIIKIHLVFWFAVTCIAFFHILPHLENPLITAYIISTPVRLMCNISTFYFFYFLITEKRFNKKGYAVLIVIGFIYTVLFGLFSAYVYVLPYAFYLSPDNPFLYTLQKGLKNNIYFAAAYTVTFIFLGSLAKISLIWYRNQIKKKEIEKQNISNELAMLKIQVNPHFLFNTMNNIKSLIKSRPPEAVNSIDKLSDIMHYMIYDSSYEKVPLAGEIRHINNYLELEKIRFSDSDYVNFEIKGECSEIRIPPLIFMPFIENAFKHGNRLKKAPGIIIKIIIDESEIQFESFNYKKDNRETQNTKSGFGLTNIRRRLELLFGKKYNLEINDDEKNYSVKLNLNLK